MYIVFKIVLFFSFVNFGIIFLEFFLSLYKKDSIYSVWGTIGNVCNGVVLRFVSDKAVTFHFAYFAALFTLFGHAQAPFSAISFLYCLLLVDFVYYLFHRMHHSVSFLWMFHHVHHGDDRLNLSTAYRISWIEQLYLSVFFVPIVLIGFSPVAVLAAFYLLSIYQFFCHSSYLKLPLWLNWILVTPNNHRTHHDQEERHQNSNFGGVFSIWDRLFGTYTAHIDTFTPGIKGYHQDNFIRIQTDPIRSFFSKKT